MGSRLVDSSFLKVVVPIVVKKSTCLRRKIGCIIVRNGHVVSEESNGAPLRTPTCAKLGCPRALCESGETLDRCRAVHAEEDAVTRAARNGDRIDGGTLYVTHLPCAHCQDCSSTRALKGASTSMVLPHSPKLFEQAGGM